ncbi:TldD/PmbA family protein [Parvularcula sp. LCG005]|uniref:TldD/PmbA family protein n=1 Tax=Parvularcula sp. LCG005 TaxID=3078805 RepID=UPI002942339F|nr:TldD/PmbA family protein [Parvularcula sp. LCG005]WOI53689.1 TldD/PmbA family protein [Parvularcula sp. LCG005]
MTEKLDDILAVLLNRATAAGADAADALIYRSVSDSVSVRLGEVEDIERSESRDLGLRVLIGQRQASVSTTDFSDNALNELVERAVAMARLAPADPYCGLADPSLLAEGPFEDLDMFDGEEPPADVLKQRALDCEAAALGVDGVTTSSGAGASVGYGQSWFATSHGFSGSSTGGSHSLSVSVIAGEGTGMERDYDYGSATHLSDMRAPDEIGRCAGERAVKRLKPRKLESQKAPVIFDKRLARSLLSPLSGAVNGGAIARGTSFLKDRMGQQLFPAHMTITDDPFIKRGFGSRNFDGEGIRPAPLHVIQDGVLTTWILNSSQGRQLGLPSNGRAKRGTGGPPGSGTFNFDLGPGEMSPEELYRDTGKGLLVTDMFGPQINPNTGDYSVGCSGFWISGGVVGEPVSEITIAGNLLEMWLHLTAANDFERKGSTNAPSLRIEQMTIAGS